MIPMSTAAMTVAMVVLSFLSHVSGGDATVANNILNNDGFPDCFLSMGDWGGVNEMMSNLTTQMEVILRDPGAYGCRSIPFLLALGDNFYNIGVNSTTDPQWKATYQDQFRVPGTLLSQLPFYVIAGNHDYDQQGSGSVSPSRVQVQLDYAAIDPLWRYPARNYTLDQTFSNGTTIRFLFVDTEPIYLCAIGNPNCFNTDQLGWIEQQLDMADQDETIDGVVFVGHHNVVGALGGHQDNRLDNVLLPYMVNHRVSVSLMAHSHYLSWGQNPSVTNDSATTTTRFPGQLWHVTNGAARGADWNSCTWQLDSPLLNRYCSNDAVSQSGAFMLHRVLSSSTTTAVENNNLGGSIEHCAYSSATGAVVDTCLVTPFRTRSSATTPAPAAAQSPYFWYYVGGGAAGGGVVLVAALAAGVAALRRHQSRRRHAYSQMETGYSTAIL